jgi:hypothetical protein
MKVFNPDPKSNPKGMTGVVSSEGWREARTEEKNILLNCF